MNSPLKNSPRWFLLSPSFSSVVLMRFSVSIIRGFQHFEHAIKPFVFTQILFEFADPLSLSLSVSIFLDHRLFVFLCPDSYRAPLRYIFAECICLIHVSQDPIPRVWQTMKASSPRFAWYCIIVANAFRLVMRISGDQEQDICAKPRGKPCLLRDLWCSLSRIAHTATINPYLVTRWWC